MKFTYQLDYNQFSKWHGNYISYKKLKKLIKQQRHDAINKDIEIDVPTFWQEFEKELSDELNKIFKFFQTISTELKVNTQIYFQ
jgi:SPX domain protein involved in polyphosphate accumulation